MLLLSLMLVLTSCLAGSRLSPRGTGPVQHLLDVNMHVFSLLKLKLYIGMVGYLSRYAICARMLKGHDRLEGKG
jgi:hypothetical protein